MQLPSELLVARIPKKRLILHAARIRDHPFMMLFRRITDHEKAGRSDAANSLRRQLEQLIHDSQGRTTLEGFKET